MKMVYIASPYTVGDVEENVGKQLKAADVLMNYKICPVVPLYSHFQNELYPRDYEDWMEIDIEKLRRCDALLRLPGESKGADKEVKFAKEHGIDVFYNMQDCINSLKGEKG